ncbi:MAG: helix-turn-helix domain-containing protein [Clostridiaceae bacterium]
MELNEKLQQLRKQKNLTQEELAGALYVSRTAVSKWESGRGYPSIDSLKTIAVFYSVSIDDLLTSGELIAIAEKDNKQKVQQIRDLVFGLIDCSIVMFFFLPVFGQKIDGVICEMPLLSLTGMEHIKNAYMVLVIATMIWGVAALTLQGYRGAAWMKWKNTISVLLSIFSTLLFIASLQPYAASFTFVFLLIKGILLIKRQ